MVEDDDMPSSSNTKYGTNKYVQYQVGGNQSKLILVATHGGSMRPESIQNRYENKLSKDQGGPYKVVCMSDLYTKEIALLLRDEIVKLTSEQYSPHLIMSELHRTKLDPNRSVNEATLGNEESTVAYNEFHNFIKTAKKSVGTGLLLDLHGQKHPEEWVELGYLITKHDLCDNNLQCDHCSVRALVSRTGVPLEEVIRGRCSLGNFLQNEGIKTIPSPEHPHTVGNYFKGGYVTFAHGSQQCGAVDAIQIETHSKYRNKENAPLYVAALAKAVVNFLNCHYNNDS